MVVFSAVAALAAAALFGASSVLMARAARATPREDAMRLRLLARLVRSRTWVAGAAIQPVSFCVQALALALGPLALVQPLASTDLLFALGLQTRASRRRMRIGQWCGALLVVGGVGGFVAISPPRQGVAVPSGLGWAAAGLIVGGGVVVCAAAAAWVTPVARTILLAGAGAGTFALVDVVSKAAVDLLRRDGASAVLTSWYPYALIALGIAGLVLSQSAFQSGALQVSLPVIDTVEPTLAVVIGALTFHEALAASPIRLATQLAAAAIALIGIIILDRDSGADE